MANDRASAMSSRAPNAGGAPLGRGVADAFVMAILGHGTMAMLRHYQRVSNELKRRAADRLDELLGG